MATLRFFKISFAIAVLCLIPAVPIWASHGGGGGGGGGGGHGSWGGGGMHYSAAHSYGSGNQFT